MAYDDRYPDEKNDPDPYANQDTGADIDELIKQMNQPMGRAGEQQVVPVVVPSAPPLALGGAALTPEQTAVANAQARAATAGSPEAALSRGMVPIEGSVTAPKLALDPDAAPAPVAEAPSRNPIQTVLGISPAQAETAPLPPEKRPTRGSVYNVEGKEPSDAPPGWVKNTDGTFSLAGAPGPTALTDVKIKDVPATNKVVPSMARYAELERRNKPLFDEVNRVATAAGIPPVSLANVLYLESEWNPNAPTSSKGAVGISQILPETAREIDPRLDPNNPRDNLWLGALYLKRMFSRYGTDTPSAYAAYYAGPGAVDTIYRLTPEDQKKNYADILNYPALVGSDRMHPFGSGTTDAQGNTRNFTPPASAPGYFSVDASGQQPPGSSAGTHPTTGLPLSEGPGTQTASAPASPADIKLDVDVNAKRPHLTGPANIDFPRFVHAVAQGGPDAGHATLQQMVPQGMTNDDALRSLQTGAYIYAITNGQDPKVAIEGALIYAQQGALRHTFQAYSLARMGSNVAAANELNIAYSRFFPDGSHAEFTGTDPTYDPVTKQQTGGGLFAQRIGPDGKRIGDKLAVSPDDIQRMAMQTAIPESYQKMLNDQQDRVIKEQHEKALETHFTNQQRQAAATDATRQAAIKQAADTKFMEAQVRVYEAEQKMREARINKGVEMVKNFEQPIKMYVDANTEFTEPAQKSALARLMMEFATRDAERVPLQTADYWAQQIVRGDFNFGPPEINKQTRDWRVPVIPKGTQSPVTYISRDILRQAGLWTFDPAKPAEPGAPVRMPPPKLRLGPLPAPPPATQDVNPYGPAMGM